MENSVKEKVHFHSLDGLRGVAAIVVVIYHVFEGYQFVGDKPYIEFMNHGYLAVDFFFMLSGFVIGYAYDDRWDKMSLGAFAKRRLIRLHPMLVIGSIFGGALYYFGGCDVFPIINSTSWEKVALVTLLGCLLIPTRGSLDIRGWTEG